jgi:hypothetical protein
MAAFRVKDRQQGQIAIRSLLDARSGRLRNHDRPISTSRAAHALDGPRTVVM